MNSTTDPFTLFSLWFDEASGAEPDVPDAMQLTTADGSGRPSIRTVLLKAHGPSGFVFYTNTRSRKGQEIAVRARVAALFHWKSLARQVIVEGAAQPVKDSEADAYFATRARGSQVGAWASEQGRHREPGALEQRVAELEAEHAGGDVPRPPHWSGYRIVPDRIEFWQGRASRLHDRLVFVREGAQWASHRIDP
ncbi:MAG: pyridoxamine 5'-phosphate oxidase [Myxococcota bacterium]|jgi:pyridoxamine 5'-phosphate oxidase